VVTPVCLVSLAGGLTVMNPWVVDLNPMKIRAKGITRRALSSGVCARKPCAIHPIRVLTGREGASKGLGEMPNQP
jgi:hypothetical protein